MIYDLCFSHYSIILFFQKNKLATVLLFLLSQKQDKLKLICIVEAIVKLGLKIMISCLSRDNPIMKGRRQIPRLSKVRCLKYKAIHAYG